MLPVIRFVAYGSEIEIHTYGVMIAMAIIIGCIGIFRQGIFLKLSKKRSLILLVTMAFVSLISARLMYGVLYYSLIIENPLMIFEISFKNFTLYGALIGGALTLWFFCKKWQIPILAFMDRLVLPLALSLILSRMACFLNGCCYGKVTQVPWGIIAKKGSVAYQIRLVQNPLSILQKPAIIHPTQLYELVVILIAFGVSYLYSRGYKYLGARALSFALVLSMGRFIVFWFRDFPVATLISNVIRGPITYGLAIALLLVWMHKLNQNYLDMEDRK